MNITIFNRPYWIRRFGEQTEYKGYLSASFTDMVVSLHVHPLGSETVTMLDEGERIVRRLEGHGTDVLYTADQNKGQKGDLLYYKKHWYECRSSEDYDHTVLRHYNYQFILVPLDGSEPFDLYDPPVYDPKDYINTSLNGTMIIPDGEQGLIYDPGKDGYQYTDDEGTVNGQ